MPDVPPEVLDRLRAICGALPETYEESAWIGVRWRVRKRTFAHVYTVDEESTTVLRDSFAIDGELTALTFRAAGDELLALREEGPPFYYPGWGRDVMGLRLDDATDWDEVAELITDSFCVMAPRKLAARVRDVG